MYYPIQSLPDRHNPVSLSFIGYSREPQLQSDGSSLTMAHEIKFDRFRGWIKTKSEPVIDSDVLFIASMIPDTVRKTVIDKLNSSHQCLDAVLIRSVKGLSALFAYEPAYANELSELRLPFYGALVPAQHRLKHSLLEGDAEVAAVYQAPNHHGAHPTLMNETYIFYPMPFPLRNQQSSVNNIYGGKMTAKGMHCKAVHTLRRFQEITPMIDHMIDHMKAAAEKKELDATPDTHIDSSSSSILALFLESLMHNNVAWSTTR